MPRLYPLPHWSWIVVAEIEGRRRCSSWRWAVHLVHSKTTTSWTTNWLSEKSGQNWIWVHKICAGNSYSSGARILYNAPLGPRSRIPKAGMPIHWSRDDERGRDQWRLKWCVLILSATWTAFTKLNSRRTLSVITVFTANGRAEVRRDRIFIGSTKCNFQIGEGKTCTRLPNKNAAYASMRWSRWQPSANGLKRVFPKRDEVASASKTSASLLRNAKCVKIRKAA